MFKTSRSSVNLLFFENNNINPKDYFRQPNEKKNNNNIKTTKPHEPLQENISQNLLALSKESSNSFSFSDFEDNTNEIKNNKICDEFIFPIPDFDIFDYSKCIQISTQDGDDDEEIKKEKNELNDVDEDSKSTGPTEPNQNKIELVKKAEIDKKERKKSNNYYKYNKYNNYKNRKSPSCTKKIRERSRTKYNWF